MPRCAILVNRANVDTRSAQVSRETLTRWRHAWLRQFYLAGDETDSTCISAKSIIMMVVLHSFPPRSARRVLFRRHPWRCRRILCVVGGACVVRKVIPTRVLRHVVAGSNGIGQLALFHVMPLPHASTLFVGGSLEGLSSQSSATAGTRPGRCVSAVAPSAKGDGDVLRLHCSFSRAWRLTGSHHFSMVVSSGGPG